MVSNGSGFGWVLGILGVLVPLLGNEHFVGNSTKLTYSAVSSNHGTGSRVGRWHGRLHITLCNHSYFPAKSMSFVIDTCGDTAPDIEDLPLNYEMTDVGDKRVLTVKNIPARWYVTFVVVADMPEQQSGDGPVSPLQIKPSVERAFWDYGEVPCIEPTRK